MHPQIPIHPAQKIIDCTKLDAYCGCPRYFFFNHILGWNKEADSHALDFGAAVHLAFEYIYDQWAKNGPGYKEEDFLYGYNLFLESYRKNYPQESDVLFKPKDPENFFKLLFHYIDHYKWQDKFEVIYAEISGALPIEQVGEEFKNLYFRLDAVIKLPTGQYAVLEHKTSSWDKNSWSRGWDLKHQMGMGNYLMFLLYQQEAYGVIVNGLLFGRERKDGSRGNDFHRLPIQKSPTQLEDWRVGVSEWIRRMERDWEMLDEAREEDVSLRAFPKQPGYCIRYNHLCPMYDICNVWENPLQHLDRLPMNFTQRFWDPREMDKTFKADSAKEMRM